MSRFKIVIEYDGSGFVGWQRQENGPSVQQAVEEAIERFCGEPATVFAAGRTDAGVHALGQIASFAAEIEVPREGWVSGLNSRLPEDIVVHDAQPCFRRYNPRFHAAHKRYRYLVRCGQQRDPIIRRHAWHVGPKGMRRDVPSAQRGVGVEDYLDIDAMRLAASHFVGEHDFRAFRQSGDEREIVVREMFEVRVITPWLDRRDLVAFEIVGNAFMKNMVRIMAGTLVDVGRGRIEPAAIPGMLCEASERSDAGETAPAHGLTLVDIELARFDGPGDAFDRPSAGEPPKRPRT